MTSVSDGARTGLFAAFFLVLALAGAALYRLEQTRGADSSVFAETMRGHLRRLDGASAAGRVVFLGSSTLQGLDVSAVTPIGLNLAIGGDTLAGLAERAAGYRSLALARAVVVNIGLNDLMRDCAQPAIGVDAVLASVPKNTPIIVLGIQELNMSKTARQCGGALSMLIAEFNRRLENACRERNACRFVANPVGAGAPVADKEALLEADGIHLSVRGYQFLAAALSAVLSGISPQWGGTC